MSTIRRPLAFCAATFLIAATWTAFVWSTEIGVSFYLVPGKSIAETLLPCDTPQPFVPKRAGTVEEAFGELIVDVMVRCGLPQAIMALEVSAAFWLIVLPLVAFIVVWLRRRSYV